ncbi:MAG: hypothetical protein IKX62_01850 [Bacteroidales bacterium]|nr:hypothetical protein [Bacteroidales bacterium]
MNKKRLILTIAATAVCAAAAAQTTAEEFQARYERLVRNVGYAGVGVETLIDRWEEAFPDDPAVPMARFNYYFLKGQSTEIVPVPGERRYLGKAPVMTLKDPQGELVPYFEEDFYDEEYFGEAVKVLDRQIAAHPDELRWRYAKVAALSAYEKESPDMAAAELKTLIKRQETARPSWTLDGEPAGEDVFQQGVGELCAAFFDAGSPASLQYFFDISERMNKLYPKNPAFLDNIGSFWQVAKGNDKQAAKYYKKALKLDPTDYAATRNLQIIEKKQQAAKKK